MRKLATVLGFNPRAPCGTRLLADVALYVKCLFQSTRPVRDATIQIYTYLQSYIVSIHAPRAGRDGFISPGSPRKNCFNPRAPCGTRHFGKPLHVGAIAFQSTRPVRDATSPLQFCRWCKPVSIHAPRAGRDTSLWRLPPFTLVSIHAPRAGRDLPLLFVFLHLLVSIHAPRAGRDPIMQTFISINQKFQSTRPVRDATPRLVRMYDQLIVSIHAPRAGRDLLTSPLQTTLLSFNPRAPCGTRQITEGFRYLLIGFQSTRPVRDATHAW